MGLFAHVHAEMVTRRQNKPESRSHRQIALPGRAGPPFWHPGIYAKSKNPVVQKCHLWVCDHPMTHPQHLPLPLPWELVQKQEMAVCLLLFVGKCSLSFWLSSRLWPLQSRGWLSLLIFASLIKEIKPEKHLRGGWVSEWTKAFQVLQ